PPRHHRRGGRPVSPGPSLGDCRWFGAGGLARPLPSRRPPGGADADRNGSRSYLSRRGCGPRRVGRPVDAGNPAVPVTRWPAKAVGGTRNRPGRRAAAGSDDAVALAADLSAVGVVGGLTPYLAVELVAT